jgi:branched-chain amino acid transport system substrate-binding protein
MKTKYYKWFLLSIVVLSLLIWACLKLYEEEKNAIHIAFVGPLSGNDAIVGQAMRRAIQLYLDIVNGQRKINQKKIILDAFDDQNDPKQAIKAAQKIVAQNRAIAIIGHNYSACSISAGQFYKEQGIPAISPASTHIQVTEGNEWYFRTVFNDNLQGNFLANYAKRLLQQNTVSIIYTDTVYGSYIAEVFEKKSKKLNVEIKYKWLLSLDNDLRENLVPILSELLTKPDAGLIFLATHAPEGILLVKLIKDAGIENPLIAPDSLASKTFSQGFNMYIKEKLSPGYYTNGIHVSTPFLLDTANRYAQQLNSIYEEKYGGELPWQAFFAVDAAMVILEAIKQAEIQGKPETRQTDRKKIRDAIALFNTPKQAVEGSTGLNYFDKHGNAAKSVLMGLYKKNHLISTFQQLNTVDDFNRHIVYTGIQFNEISNFDPKTLTYTQDFYLWFRFEGTINPQDIVFLNAVEPIQLYTPLADETIGRKTYRLYRIKGQFKANIHFSKENIFSTRYRLGVSFRHRDLDRNHLVYVKDVLGMALTDSSLDNQIKEIQKLSALDEWIIKGLDFFQATVKKKTLGDPKYLLRSNTVEYSAFNAEIWIDDKAYFYQTIIPAQFCTEFFILSGIISLLLILFSYKEQRVKYLQSIWFLQVIFAFILLISTEIFVERWMVNNIHIVQIQMIFELLWWIIPALLLKMAVERFLWNPLEKKTERSIPNLVRFLVSLLIYLLAALGIVGFVFEQAVTSLLATSSVVAMIIGLGIQINLANIFSGIGLSIERSFRIGDWVKIGAFDEGQVINMNWRVTQIETRKGYILSLPNSTVSKSDIHNFSYPDNEYRLQLTVPIAPKYDPEKVEKILLNAVLSVKEVIKDFKPFIWLKDIQTANVSDWVAIYVVLFKTKNYHHKSRILKQVWKSIWRHMNQEGIIPITPHYQNESAIQPVLKSDDLQKMTAKK